MNLEEIKALNGRPHIEVALPLRNSRGYGRIVRFDYDVDQSQPLPIVISPHIMTLGNPLLTRQPVYFLSDVECVIRTLIPLPNGSVDMPTWIRDSNIVSSFQQKADACLFDYSIRNPKARLTTHTDKPAVLQVPQDRVTRSFSWIDAEDAEYLSADGDKAAILDSTAVDALESLHQSHSKRLLRKLREISPNTYICDTKGMTSPNDNPHVIYFERPYSYYDMHYLSTVIPINHNTYPKMSRSTNKINNDDELREWFIDFFNEHLTTQYGIEASGHLDDFFEADQSQLAFLSCNCLYNQRLLDFYFSGLGSHSPVNEFRGYYGVVEYLFSGEGREEDQIIRVVEDNITNERLQRFLRTDIDQKTLDYFQTYAGLVGQKAVVPLSLEEGNIREVVAKRIYQFRNAIVHSKQTWKGRRNFNISPSSIEEFEIVSREAQLLKIIAQEVVLQAGIDI